MSDPIEPNPDDIWQDQSLAAVHRFGLALHRLHATNPWPELPLLPRAIDQLMTELWDLGFSQAEIREAFEAAVVDLPRYAAGEEVRS